MQADRVFSLHFPECVMPQLFEYQGFGYASWWNGNFSAPASAQSLDEIVGAHANSVAVTASYVMASRTASDIYADPLKTESLANVGTAIDQAHARGLTVLLKPHVDPLDGAAPLHGSSDRPAVDSVQRLVGHV